MNVPNCEARQIAELGRELKTKIATTIERRCVSCGKPKQRLGIGFCDECSPALTLEQRYWALRGCVDAARQWLREGAPGRALEVLDAAKERLK